MLSHKNKTNLLNDLIRVLLVSLSNESIDVKKDCMERRVELILALMDVFQKVGI